MMCWAMEDKDDLCPMCVNPTLAKVSAPEHSDESSDDPFINKKAKSGVRRLSKVILDSDDKSVTGSESDIC